MSITIDHVGIPAADPEASARFLGQILGEGDTSPDGPDGEMVNLSIGHGALTYFELPAHEPHHVAFRVTESVLVRAIEWLRGHDVPFGNDPDGPPNGQTSDPLGSLGRIYFRDPNGHLFELFVPAPQAQRRVQP
jgi:catechol 2,3-dioxygenase-like lactoylglutathione lyase family enzyme